MNSQTAGVNFLKFNLSQKLYSTKELNSNYFKANVNSFVAQKSEN